MHHHFTDRDFRYCGSNSRVPQTTRLSLDVLGTDGWMSSAIQQRKMTRQILRCLENVTTTANFSYFYLELNEFVPYSAGATFNIERHIG